MTPADEAQLDNPAFAALNGPHACFAQVSGRARRYHPDVAPFLGMPSPPSDQDWRDATDLVAPGSFAALPHAGGTPPQPWKAIRRLELVQMVGGEQVAARSCAEAIQLGVPDVPEMLELVAQTEPGPFSARTVELGDYVGIRRDGALVAMAGERFRLDGWTEISAVCTRPDHRGQGLAAGLLGDLVARIRGRSDGVFLHVLASNSGAIRLYEQLGFHTRRSTSIVVLLHVAPRAASLRAIGRTTAPNS